MVAVSSAAVLNDPSRKVTGANNAFGMATANNNNNSNGNNSTAAGRSNTTSTSVQQQQMDSARHRPLPQIEPHEQVIFIEDNLLPDCTLARGKLLFAIFVN